MQRPTSRNSLVVALLLLTVALVAWGLVLRTRNSGSSLSEKDLPASMRVDPNAPPTPITGPIPQRPQYVPGR